MNRRRFGHAFRASRSRRSNARTPDPIRGRATYLCYSFLVSIAALAGLLAQPGCSSSTEPIEDFRIQGLVSDNDGPIPDLQVYASRVDLGPSEFYEVRTTTDSLGLFTAWVAEGDYEVRIETRHGSGNVYWSREGLRPFQAQADPIAVRAGQSLSRLDCRLGGIDIRIEAGAEHEGARLRWYLRTLALDDPVYESPARIEDGVAQLEGKEVPPGDYRVHLTDSDRQESADIELTDLGSLRTTSLVTVGRDAPREYLYSFPPPAEVTFRIDGDAPADEFSTLSLALYDANLDRSSPPFRTLTTPLDESGQVTVPIVFPRALKVAVDWRPADTRFTAAVPRWIGSYDRTGATVFPITPGSPPEEIVTHGRSMEVALTRPLRMEGQFGAQLDLLDATGEDLVELTFPDLGDGGTLRLHNLLPGDHFLRLSTSQYRIVTQWYAGGSEVAESWEDASPIVVPASGPIPHLDWSPVLGATLSGRVLRPDGSPVTNDSVFLTSDLGRGIAATVARTDASGYFRGEGLMRGRYKLGVYEAPSTRWLPGVVDWDSATVIVIDEFTEYENLDVVFR